MTGLITLRRPAVLALDPEPPELEDGRPLGWSIREVRGLRFARWRAQRGDFDGDRFGLAPEPMPPIVREVDR
jgi:hypothetical protein